MTTSAPSQLHSLANDYAAARLMMVEGQIRPNRVDNPVLLDRLELIPRELFVEAGQETLAYRENEVAASTDTKPTRYLMAPMTLARMIEALNIKAGERVLDIAPATGYSTAILTGLTDNVTSLESDARLATRAMQTLNSLSIRANVTQGPLTMGAKENAPYDAIFVGGAVNEVPAAWLAQLGEGGRLVVIVGGQKDLQLGAVTLYRKFNGQVSSLNLFEAAASTLPGFAAAEAFVF